MPPFSLLPHNHDIEVAQRESAGVGGPRTPRKTPEGKGNALLGSFLQQKLVWEAQPIWEEPKVTILVLLWAAGRPWQLCDHSGSAPHPLRVVTQGNEVTAGWINIAAILACGYQ